MKKLVVASGQQAGVVRLWRGVDPIGRPIIVSITFVSRKSPIAYTHRLQYTIPSKAMALLDYILLLPEYKNLTDRCVYIGYACGHITRPRRKNGIQREKM